MNNQVHIIVNPEGGAGRCGRLWQKKKHEIDALIAGAQVHMSRYAGHARILAKEAVVAGATRIVVAGGDGTINEVLNGMLGAQTDISCKTELGVVPLGTGCDFVRSLHIPDAPVQAMAYALQGQAHACDVGLVEYETDGGVKQRYFINAASAGLGGVVADKVNQSGKWLGGKLSFLLATFQGFLAYAPENMQLFINQQRMDSGQKHLIIAIANGRFFGGGMCVGEHASLEDEYFDVVEADAMALPEMLGALGQLHAGKTPDTPKIRHYRCQHVRVESQDVFAVECDGESLHTKAISFSLCPAYVPVVGLKA